MTRTHNSNNLNPTHKTMSDTNTTTSMFVTDLADYNLAEDFVTACEKTQEDVAVRLGKMVDEMPEKRLREWAKKYVTRITTINIMGGIAEDILANKKNPHITEEVLKHAQIVHDEMKAYECFESEFGDLVDAAPMPDVILNTRWQSIKNYEQCPFKAK